MRVTYHPDFCRTPETDQVENLHLFGGHLFMLVIDPGEHILTKEYHDFSLSICRWCSDQFGPAPDRWRRFTEMRNDLFRIVSENDATAFRIRWG